MNTIRQSIRGFRSFLATYPNIIVGTSLCVGVVGFGIVPDTVLVNKYRRQYAVRICEDGEEKELSTDLQELSQTVLDKVLLDPMYEANLDFFVVNRLDPFTKGSSCMRTGAIIGLPLLFDHKKIEDVTQSSMWFGDTRFESWDTETGQMLSQSLLLSERAKKFAIARDIVYTNDLSPYFRLAFWFGGFYGITYVLKWSSSFFAWRRTPVIVRRLCYTTSTLFLLLMTKFAVDIYDNSRHRRCDKLAANLDEEYARGGVEYYTKVLQRNQMCRKIMGAKAETHYTPYGNEVQPWYKMTIQITERKDNLIKRVAEYEAAREKAKEAAAKKKKEEEEAKKILEQKNKVL